VWRMCYQFRLWPQRHHSS